MYFKLTPMCRTGAIGTPNGERNGSASRATILVETLVEHPEERLVLGGTYGVTVQGINLVRGKPFRVSYLVDKFERIVKAIS